MIPDTRNGLPAMATISAMQKAIRRGMEREAMEFACELIHTSKAFHTMVCNRLEVICHEDLDTSAAPWIVPFVATATAQSKDRYSKSIGEARLMIGNCIRLMCRSPKSRAGCHFAAVIGLRSMLEDFAPTIPDYALDMHTMKGKAMGRGLDHFREEGGKLVPEPTEPDLFVEEAYGPLDDQAAGQGTARAGLDVNEPKRFASVHAVQRYVRCLTETGSSQRS
jgi:replication-associated recombination protein RarA